MTAKLKPKMTGIENSGDLRKNEAEPIGPGLRWFFLPDKMRIQSVPGSCSGYLSSNSGFLVFSSI
ncbi:MAG: hypothetical protein ACU85E_18260, partial [Gammaproteobacteria bacterium]